MQRFKLFFVLLFISAKVFSQGTAADSTFFSIYYSSPKEYIIAGIDVKGVKSFDNQVLIQISGLSVGDKIMVPGDAITNSIKKLWNHGLFSDIKIEASKISGDNIWLSIILQARPRMSAINYHGVSKGEQDEIGKKVVMMKGSQITDHQLNSAQKVIKNFFLEKGYLNTEVNIIQRDDTTDANSVIIDINVDKKEKVKIAEIVFHGNQNLKTGKLEHALKKTKAKKPRNFLHNKKFLAEKYEEDKINLIKKYNEEGYRDATIIEDSITKLENNRIKLDIWLAEGDKYFFRNIKWVGNTIYPADYLNAVLGIKKGDVFDQKFLDKRSREDEDAVSGVYQDHGYLFSSITPVETNIENDSIDFDMRVYEGPQATINKILISGNNKTNEHVARREIRTLPGDLYSKSDIVRTVRELAQLGHFDQESIVPDVRPHVDNGTVDIEYQLTEKANDQVELSGGWGANMFVGTLGLKFSNFSVRNILNKEAWRPLPSGDGQSLALRAQTSGKFYKSYSIEFTEPWFGGKKPNSFTFSFSHQRVNYSANNSYSSMYDDYYGNGYGSGYGSYYGGYSPYGYGGYNPYGYGYGSGYGSGYDYGSNYNYTDGSTKDDQIQVTTTAAIGYGYRLKWPDDYFTIYHELSFQHYKLQNMGSYYYFLSDGTGNGNGGFNNFSLKTAFGRNSTDSPIFTRSGSNFSLSLQLTPPYSVLNGVDYSNPKLSNSDRYKWIEYHKWMFKGDWFSPLTNNRNLILHTKFEYGFLGYYNKYRRSPFEGFRLGGSGMSGYNLYGSDIVSLRGYKDYSLSPSTGSSIYNKLSVELRYPVILKPQSTIFVLGFLDAGNAWNNFEDYNPFKLHRSAGAGVRIFLPMFGLLGIDWGYGFDKVTGQPDAAGGQFHFVIGQQF